MTDAPHANRRTVLIAAVTAAAAMSAPALAHAAETLGAAIAIFEADEPAARAFARTRGVPVAIDGDRIRFARRLFRERRPPRVIAITRYADFLLLAESAREEGYKASLVDRPAPDSGGLFVWTAART